MGLRDTEDRRAVVVREGAHDVAALVVAHPGHELRVHHWLETARPITFVLTQGDGRAGVSRLHSTARILRSAGAPTGAIFGAMSDREVYAAILGGRHEVFLALLDQLARAFVEAGVSRVAADAEEGHNTAHDVCHHLAAAAAAMASRRTRRTVASLEFPVVGGAGTVGTVPEGSLWLELDDEAWARKLESANGYPEMREEVARARARNGDDAFRVECLRPSGRHRAAPFSPPFYETYGERQVAAGHYPEVIRYARHIRPLIEALRRHAGIGA